MPELQRPGRGLRHTVDTAAATLSVLGVAAHQIVIEKAGGGWPDGWIVGQDPKAGEPLGPRTRIRLTVAGNAGLNSLPFPLRDSQEDEFRADRLFALFDNPIAKLGLHVREAGEYFALRPEDPERSRQWIEELFGFGRVPWPEQNLYAVALMLSALHQLAGQEAGIRLAFRLVFDLPVSCVRLTDSEVSMRSDHRTRLGTSFSRLGLSAVAGIGLQRAAGIEVEFGPLDVETYRTTLDPRHRELRQELYRLVLPMHLFESVKERWRVGDPADPIRIGQTQPEVLLGYNSYLAIREHGGAA
ncbi:MAG: type VI secretion system baseplate subunit TssG [Planctomycetota bacterium]|jgi:predicted component of type VI protein secretion system